jgi:hypothetical protein
MLYRDRRLAKADRLQDWSEANAARSDAAEAKASEMASHIPFGQPILVGHHSEGRDRRYRGRIQDNMRKSIELADKAEEQASRANNIRAAVESSIYDDDPDAIERLTEKLAGLVAKQGQMKAANAAYRTEHRASLKIKTPWERDQAMPYQSYAISNNNGVIATTRKRLERLTRERDMLAAGKDLPYRVIVARFDSECASCGAGLSRGDQIKYNKAQGARCLPACGAHGQT